MASIIRAAQPSSVVYGSIVRLSPSELRKLDVYEGCDSSAPFQRSGNIYYHQRVSIVSSRTGGREKEEPAIAYVKTDLEWRGEPSSKYLRACQTNIAQFWPAEAGSIAIRRVVKNPATKLLEVELVRKWPQQPRQQSRQPQQPAPAAPPNAAPAPRNLHRQQSQGDIEVSERLAQVEKEIDRLEAEFHAVVLSPRADKRRQQLARIHAQLTDAGERGKVQAVLDSTPVGRRTRETYLRSVRKALGKRARALVLAIDSAMESTADTGAAANQDAPKKNKKKEKKTKKVMKAKFRNNIEEVHFIDSELPPNAHLSREPARQPPRQEGIGLKTASRGDKNVQARLISLDREIIELKEKYVLICPAQGAAATDANTARAYAPHKRRGLLETMLEELFLIKEDLESTRVSAVHSIEGRTREREFARWSARLQRDVGRFITAVQRKLKSVL